MTERQYYSNVGSVLKSQGRSVSWFCRNMGCSRALFYRVEDGSRTPTAAYRHRAASLLGLPEALLFVSTESLISDEMARMSEAVAV